MLDTFNKTEQKFLKAVQEQFINWRPKPEDSSLFSLSDHEVSVKLMYDLPKHFLLLIGFIESRELFFNKNLMQSIDAIKKGKCKNIRLIDVAQNEKTKSSLTVFSAVVIDDCITEAQFKEISGDKIDVKINGLYINTTQKIITIILETIATKDDKQTEVKIKADLPIDNPDLFV